MSCHDMAMKYCHMMCDLTSSHTLYRVTIKETDTFNVM
jgi:hypothetical protein